MPGEMTREEVLRRAAAGGMALSAAGVLAACGDDDDGGGGTTGAGTGTAAEEGTPKKGGVLRIGIVGGGSGDTLNPPELVAETDFCRIAQLFDPLTEFDVPKYDIVNALAEELTPNDAGDEWTIRLKEGVEWHDGKTLSADDLIFTFEQYTAKLYSAPRLPWLKMEWVKKVDDRTVKLEMPEPRSTVFSDLCNWATSLMPVGFDKAKPIGTGPFKFQSFTPGRESVFVRNENYWRDVWVDEVRILNFADGTAGLNALTSGQIDALDPIPYTQVEQVKNNPDIKLSVSETGAWNPFCMRVDVKPFDDPNVRLAVKLAIDRQQLVDAAWAGQGRVANDIFSPADPGFNKDIPQRERDVEQAKSLFAAAGVSRLVLDCADVSAGVIEGAQVLAQQLKEAGVDCKLRQVDPGTYYGDKYLQYTFSVDYWSSPPWTTQWQQILRNNEPHWAQDRPGGLSEPETQWLDLYNTVNRTVDDDERNGYIRDAQQIEHDSGGYVIWGYRNVIDAYSAKLAGYVSSPEGHDLGNYTLRKVYFT